MKIEKTSNKNKEFFVERKEVAPFIINYNHMTFSKHSEEMMLKRGSDKQNILNSLLSGYTTYENFDDKNHRKRMLPKSYLLVCNDYTHILINENNNIISIMLKSAIKNHPYVRCKCAHCNKIIKRKEVI